MLRESFNPRSRTGNDGDTLQDFLQIDGFQSTFPHGERRGSRIRKMVRMGVSIHVPARGTTHIRFHPAPNLNSFNPRSRTGNDKIAAIQAAVVNSFNPRSRTGNDGRGGEIRRGKGVSIHVPARGTTPWESLTDKGFVVSIHVPARGTTGRGVLHD